jgi:large subunit ribosomal protein L35
MLRLRAKPLFSGSLARLNSTVAPTSVSATGVESSPTPAAATSPNASASNSSATSPADSKPKAATKTRGRRKRGAATRSLAVRGEKREWNQPVAPGALPVYDEALKVIRADSRALKAELDGVRTRLAGVKDTESNEAKTLAAKAKILEVQSQINLPDVRWKFRNGQGRSILIGNIHCTYTELLGDLSKLVYRHLAEQKWRKEGSLDMLVSGSTSSVYFIQSHFHCRWNVYTK